MLWNDALSIQYIQIILHINIDDIAATKRIVHACKIMGICVHEHLIISMFDDTYYSFADNGVIKKFNDAIT